MANGGSQDGEARERTEPESLETQIGKSVQKVVQLEVDLAKHMHRKALRASMLVGSLSMLFSNIEPRVMDVYDWWVESTRLGPWARFVLVLVLYATISSMLGLFGVGCAYLYAHGFDWENRARVLIFGVLGSLFTGWNVAQYASFTIQTTGHQTLTGHLTALRTLGPYLAIPNVLGWATCCVCAFAIPQVHVIVHILLIASPAIVGGIFVKTYRKLSYVRLRAEEGFDDHSHDDALSFKVMREEQMGEGCLCPFATVQLPLVLRQALGPLTCFLWTVGYAVVLRGALLLIFKLPGGREGWQQVLGQICCFFSSKFFFYVGAEKLKKWIANMTGLLAYSNKMCIAFFFIYATVTNSMMRVSVVAAQGNLRVAFSILQPVSVFLFFVIALRKFRPVFAKAKALHEEAKQGRGLAEYALVDTKCARATCGVMGTLITGNVVCLSFTGMSCIFIENPNMRLDMGGKCPLGLPMQFVKDGLPVWIMSVVECVVLVRVIEMPCVYFFMMLDPFLVLCTLVTLYLNVSFVMIQASIWF